MKLESANREKENFSIQIIKIEKGTEVDPKWIRFKVKPDLSSILELMFLLNVFDLVDQSLLLSSLY